MVEVIGRYGLRGSYLLNDLEGSQIGEVVLCSDGKLVGSVRDSNSPLDSQNLHYGLDKTLLGLIFPEDSSIGFLKLVPQRSGFSSVIWHATPVTPVSTQQGLYPEYDGLWQWGGIWTPADELQTVLDRGIPLIDQMIETPFPYLREIYFNPDRLKFLRESAEGMRQIGKLYFEKLELK